ncbi:MAG: F0F1 ATP synthase subunit epsilon [Minwuia sp.]|uniref:F0F1 ATP synthase subunit epsilon n=1 Tax=Minwuia sp. TaxID=2493630 RepID=UPI003A851715
MADNIHFELVSPEALLVSGEASMVTAPGTEGDFAVLPGHAPLVSTLRPGAVEVFENGSDQPAARYFVAGGFAEVALDKFTVLAETAVPMDQVDRAHLEQEIQNAKEDLEDAGDDEEKKTALEEKLSQLEDLLGVHG